jgi:hypothetical protein
VFHRTLTLLVDCPEVIIPPDTIFQVYPDWKISVVSAEGMFKQTEAGPEIVGCGNGFTVNVNTETAPVHVTLALVNDGVTMMVAITGEAVMLVAVKAEIFPDPLAASPMELFELTQL